MYPAYQPAYRPPVPYQPQPMWPAPAPYPVRRSAPASVHLLAFPLYLGTLLFALAAGSIGVLTATGHLDSGELSGYPADELTVLGIVGASVFGVVALFHLLLGRALQRGRQWARVLMLVFAVFGLLGAAANVVLVTGDLTLSLIGLVGPVLTILLLNTRAARSWFRYGTY